MSQELNGFLSNESNLSGSINNGANLIGSFIQGGGGGTSDYNDLDNKPSINNVTLSGNKTSHDLGLMPETTLAAVATSGDYDDLINKPVIPDMTDYYNKTETDSLLDDKVDQSQISQETIIFSESGTINVARVIGDGSTGHNNVKRLRIGPYYVQSDIDSMLAQKADSSSLAAVATTGDYNDLINKPVLPTQVIDISSQFTITKSSGNWSVNSVEAYRSGTTIQITIKFNGNGNSVSAGSNGFVGTITAGPLPVSTVRLVGYYNNCPVMLNVDPNGALTARVTAVNVTVTASGILPLGGIYLTNN